MLHHLILSLYVLQAPRRNIDYCLMKLSNDMTDTNFNYLDLKNKQFIFNNYKTDHKYNTIEIPIEDNLFKVIQAYLKHHPQRIKLKNKKHDVHFLVWMDGEPINKSSCATTFAPGCSASRTRPTNVRARACFPRPRGMWHDWHMGAWLARFLRPLCVALSDSYLFSFCIVLVCAYVV